MIYLLDDKLDHNPPVPPIEIFSSDYRVVETSFEVVVDRSKWDEALVDYKMYGIHMAFYREDGSLSCLTENAVEPYGDTLESLKESMVEMSQALLKPILIMQDILDENAKAST